MAPTLGDPADAWRYRQTVVPFRVNQGTLPRESGTQKHSLADFSARPNNVEIELNFEVA